MRVADELTGPLGYSGWLLALGLGCVVAVVAGYGLLAWRGWRRETPPKPEPSPVGPDVREWTLQRLDGVSASLATGGMDGREATDACSRLVRGYVAAETGRSLTTMTLADLQRSGLPQLSGLVAVLYPPQFAPDSGGDALELVARAREVVSTWR